MYLEITHTPTNPLSEIGSEQHCKMREEPQSAEASMPFAWQTKRIPEALLPPNLPEDHYFSLGSVFQKDYTCEEIEFIVNEAARPALGQKRPIITGDRLNAAGNNPPMHSDVEE